MLGKPSIAVLSLFASLVLSACGDGSGGSTSGGGTAGSGGGGGNGTTSTGGSGGTTSTGGSGGTTSTGGSGGTTTTTTTTETGCMGLGDPCTNCLADMCNATYCTCYDDPACGALVQCSQGCAGDPACNQNCFTNNPNAISEAALLNNCAATTCAASCPGTTALDGCTLCLFTSCPAQMNKCLANAECSALVTCVQGCGGDFFCQGGCYDDHPNGQDDADALSSCLQDSCSGQCG